MDIKSVKMLVVGIIIFTIGIQMHIVSFAVERNNYKNYGEKETVEQINSNVRYSVTSIPGKWINDSNGWWYRHSDGSYTVNNWEYINGNWYYFNSQGYMQTGWI